MRGRIADADRCSAVSGRRRTPSRRQFIGGPTAACVTCVCVYWFSFSMICHLLWLVAVSFSNTAPAEGPIVFRVVSKNRSTLCSPLLHSRQSPRARSARRAGTRPVTATRDLQPSPLPRAAASQAAVAPNITAGLGCSSLLTSLSQKYSLRCSVYSLFTTVSRCHCIEFVRCVHI